MIGGFGFIIYGGPLALMLTTLVVQVKCFSEIINIGYAVYRYGMGKVSSKKDFKKTL